MCANTFRTHCTASSNREFSSRKSITSLHPTQTNNTHFSQKQTVIRERQNKSNNFAQHGYLDCNSTTRNIAYWASSVEIRRDSWPDSICPPSLSPTPRFVFHVINQIPGAISISIIVIPPERWCSASLSCSSTLFATLTDVPRINIQ